MFKRKIYSKMLEWKQESDGRTALLIEGAGLAIDGYALKPLALKLKTEELKENGESVTYTREIK